MIIDARTIPNNHTLETEICIIGAGAAGISIAREFIGQPFRVSVLESGDLEFNADIQSLYKGKSAGFPYFPLQTARLRYFGGSTNHWGGRCLSFDDFDFKPREWIPYSGWPIRRSDLETYYERARSVCQLRSSELDLAYWESHDEFSPLPLIGDRVISRLAQWVPLSLRSFGKSYCHEILQAENITTYLNANVSKIETDETAKTVTQVQVDCLSGNRFKIAARLFILATGGIENARLLLLSNKRQSAGLGNQNGLVGRFFMDHVRFVAGIIRPSSPYVSTRFYKSHNVNKSIIRGYLTPSRDIQRSERLVDVQVFLTPVYDESYIKAIESQDIASFRYLLKKLKQGEKPDAFGKHLSNVVTDVMSWQKLWVNTPPLPDPKAIVRIFRTKPSDMRSLISDYLGDIATFIYYRKIFHKIPIDHISLKVRIEQAPNPDSRVTLATERDQLGQNRVRLDWRLSPIDNYSARRTLEIIGAELGRAGLGRLQTGIDDNDTTWPANTVGTWHHMGTTRMNDDPKQGVVDKNCQVHGISNLFIAGSSVFTTGGSGTPTLTLVALALRLADHIKRRMG